MHQSTSMTLDYDGSDDSDHSDSQKRRTLMRPESTEMWKSVEIKNLYNEMDAQKRFLKQAADMETLRAEMDQIKDAGGQVVDMSQKIERLESQLKIAAKDKFEQEKVIADLRT